MPSNKTHIVAGCQPWNRTVFDEVISKYSGRWYFIANPSELNLDAVKLITPRYLFFLNWSWKVPDEIINAYECVCFHPTDLPYGRGGTPIQNLILSGHTHTKVSAFRMTKEFDAGPIYLKEPLSLEGRAEEIYFRFTQLAASMMKQIIQEEPKPLPQKGEVVVFKGRKPKDSEIPELDSPQALYDFIRMLDAKDFPKAFLHTKGFCFEFGQASLANDKMVAEVTVTPLKKV